MAGLAGYQFWVSLGGSSVEPYDVDDIVDVVALSEELLDDIEDWDEHYRDLTRRASADDLEPSRHPDLAALTAEGRALGRRLRAEVPPAMQVYHHPLGAAGYELIAADAECA
ncbi:hypothetical protein F0L68_29775 [Solihabitans fulvus]|uniref:Uncharacterized protein n=1 Tax=Solihabitans fulvus TaxID=1892852 RepID=A0A5B2WWC9_9PSEU|nr:hypothetical protein [Solihabitans fulvus]KAA2254962.1 hypothetical protein F0L68_29775 [Solihabitans fulvus]